MKYYVNIKYVTVQSGSALARSLEWRSWRNLISVSFSSFHIPSKLCPQEHSSKTTKPLLSASPSYNLWKNCAHRGKGITKVSVLISRLTTSFGA
jgi:hypothetical protein